MNKINIKIINLSEVLPLPKYATELSAGVDLHANIPGSIILKPFERILIPTAIKIALPAGFMAQITPRSGLALKYGISIVNAPGIIDADYRGEIKVILINLGDKDFEITHAAKIAQMIFVPYSNAEFSIVDSLDSTERGSGGFGSTGI